MNDFLVSLSKHFGFQTIAELATDIGWRLLAAAFVILLGWLALRYLIVWVTRALERARFPDPTVRGVIRLVLRWAVILTTCFYVMLALGVQTTAILGLVTGSALAIGLAVQGTLSNVASGLMLLILRPISVGDYIQGGGHEGTVVTIGIFYTAIDTLEKFRVSIPNSALFGDAIVNLSKNPIMTGRLMLGVAYDADLSLVSKLLIESTSAVQHVLPTPQVLVQDLADSAVTLEVRFDAEREHVWAALRAARIAAKETLDANGIEIPFPQTTIHYRPTQNDG